MPHERQSHGVLIHEESRRNIVETCDIYETYVGIYLIGKYVSQTGEWWGSNTIRANHCHHTQPNPVDSPPHKGKDGILIESCRHVIVEGNTCDNNEEHGIYLSVNSGAGKGSEHVSVIGNAACSNKRAGIHLNGDANYNIRKCTVAGNVCANNGRLPPEDISGRGIVLDNYCRGIAVTGNTVSQNTERGIWEIAGQNNDYNAIVGNSATQNTQNDPNNEYQIVKSGPNSVEANNIKKYAL